MRSREKLLIRTLFPLSSNDPILGRSLLPLLVASITGAEDDSFTRSIESEQSL